MTAKKLGWLLESMAMKWCQSNMVQRMQVSAKSVLLDMSGMPERLKLADSTVLQLELSNVAR
eukprot:CAMPEP_0173106908 /NCGR_PEP_ID=MMETSP1102-20130122/41395_1 /TAXON_ID=49646 /ORGANISM="Geminigera sp., Strain Caron Lab Isolate" /LENGTH=61 /DNA_ID=CAMNT_0014004263 /DNA_START=49 /DNA_END=234 /DNA_ORIENTATION=+